MARCHGRENRVHMAGEMSDHIKFVELRASNLMRLKAVCIRPDPDGNMVVISGDNGEGKSSVLNAIAMLFGGKDQFPDTPVRRGEEIATIVGDMGSIVVTRKISSTGHTTLKVQNAEGATFSSPQRMLDELTGKLTFDPLSFSRMKPKDQAELLRELMGLDFLELLRTRKTIYDDRTEVSRTVKQIEGEIAGMPKVPEDLAPRVSVSELLVELREAEAMKTDKERQLRKVATLAGRVESLFDDRLDLQKKIDEVNANMKEASDELEAARKVTFDIPDVAAITDKISSAQDINNHHQRAHERKAAVDKLAAESSEVIALSEAIMSIDKARLAEIAAAPMPVHGLGFNEGGMVTLNGLALEQASAAEQLRVSVAIGIAMNPKLRVLLVRDASLLDDKSMAMVAKHAKDNECQLWVERIEVDGNTTVIIEDGQIKE